MEREFLIDVTRLVWRGWSGRMPTGIDRVCLAYLDHFGERAQGVVQRGGLQRVLSPAASDRLFEAIRMGGSSFRSQLLRLLPLAFGSGKRMPRTVTAQRPIYLNIGHTGLDEPSLPGWVRRNNLRAVFLVHDLIPITHPEFCRSGEATKHRARMRNVLDCAAGIIGNSQTTLDELQSFAELEQLPVPPFVPAWISGHEIPESAPQAAMDRPHFVVVGTIEGRKNHVLLFQLWRRLAERMGPRAPRLVVIGQRGWEAEHALAMLDRSPALRGHVRELGSASDAEVARLIAGARALLMPSFAEGFGLPVVEALQLGTPVICSDLPAFREIVGDIPTYLDPLDGQGWESTILAFLEDCPERMRQLRQLRDYRGPDWPSHFATVEPWLATL
ncbi:glycosyltransferase family 4 protein [Novosphingobium piscinae]|uniref:Glycosyltransferase family 4 protein n=1 Tax=Novosphingobium piscinae TaxID=1507448 RepID=A0A7X1FXY8_9SPHN|nr:glycosyltransferase family 4 protein [Novosphingobium piscinae]